MISAFRVLHALEHDYISSLLLFFIDSIFINSANCHISSNLCLSDFGIQALHQCPHVDDTDCGAFLT